MKNMLWHFSRCFPTPRVLASLAAGLTLVCGLSVQLTAAPFDRQMAFTQPDGTTIQLHGKGDEFYALFETLDGYTVVFDPAQKAYCFAQVAADGQLTSTGVQVQRATPASLGLTPGLRMSAEARKRMVVERWQRWEQGMQIQQRWAQQKAAARAFYAAKEPNGPQPSPPPFTTTGLKVGLTLLIDFSDDPATVPQAEIINFCNADNYTGYGNNGSVKSYYFDNSNGQLTYTNVVTIYVRAPQPKTVYNDITKDCGDQANILIKEALDTLKALTDYNTIILPTFNALTVDANNEVVAFNVFYTGDNGGVWMFGLWPHSWSLYNIGAQPLGNGKNVFRYQITNIGRQLSLGTFCHENGHMLCGYPDIYDYDYDSSGGAGMFCLMNSGGHGQNPVQICAYLKRASGWATTTELDRNSSLIASVTATPGTNFNHFYRFQKPSVDTEYYLVENRQQTGRDANIPASGVAIWHIDELGDRDDQSTAYNTTHANYECSLVQADNQFHLQNYVNDGDAFDLYYNGNTAAGYLNEFSDSTGPSARWWDGSDSGLLFADFSPSGMAMTFQVGFGLATLKIASTNISGGDGNGIIDVNECNDLFLVLTNGTGLGAANVQVRLSTTTPGVGFGNRFAAYPDLPAATSGTNLVPFTISTAPAFICGTPIVLSVLIKSDQVTATNTVVLETGTVGAPVRFDNNVAVAIPDNNSDGAHSLITVSNITTAIRSLTVSLYLSHTYDNDLALELIGPDGTTVPLAAGHGGSGDNYGLACSPDDFRTTFDDNAPEAIGSASAPFVGSYQPDMPLAAFVGKSGTNVNGEWKLHVVDSARFDIGDIQCWSLFLATGECGDGGGTCPGVDLALGMVDLPDPVFIGSNLVYTISVTNNGPDAATNVVVNHSLPPSVVFVSAASSQGSCTLLGSSVVCNLGSMPFSSAATITITVTPLAPETIFSTASVTSKEADTDPSNNSVTVGTRVNPPASELAVGLADAPDPTVVGGALTYHVSVTNNGPSIASGVTVTNTLPLSVNVLSATPSQGDVTFLGNIVVCNFGSLAVGGRATATIDVLPTTAAQGTIVATAKVTALQADPIPANNTATAVTTVGPSADLALTLGDTPDPVVVRSNWTYTVTVTNLGPNVASSAVVNVNLASGLRVVSTNSTQGTFSRSGNTVTCSLGNVGGGGGAVITIVVNSTNNGVFSATATASAAQTDPNSANNTAAETTTVAPPNVTFAAAGAMLTAESLSPANGTLDPGETVTVTLRLRNSGNVNNTNLVATLQATGGVTAPSDPQSYGVLLGGGLPVGKSFTFTVDGTNGGTVVATLQLQDVDVANHVTNNHGRVTFSFSLPDVRPFANTNPIVIRDNASGLPYPSTLTVSGVTGLVGRVTVTLSGFNHTFPHDVSVLLVGPTGARTLLLSHATDQGFYPTAPNLDLVFDDGAADALPASGVLASGTWRPAAYTPAPVFFTNAPPATNPPAGPYGAALGAFTGINPNGTWLLYVMDDASGDVGGIANGWSLAVHTITPVNQLADVGLTATATPNPALVGSGITYTFTLTNLGPNTASGLAFTNVLPAGATLLSATSSQGVITTNANGVFCSVGALSSGGAATVTVIATPTLAGSLTNTASLAASETDLNPANNSASVVTSVGLPVADVGVTKTVSQSGILTGSNVTFTVAVVNNGPETALNVVVTDPLPPGMNLVSATSSIGIPTNSGRTVVASLGNLNAGASATVSIVASAAVAGVSTNTALAATASSDTNPANNSSSVVVAVTAPAPSIAPAGAAMVDESFLPANAVVENGETVTVSLALRNIGSADTVNLGAKLLDGGGVTNTSGATNYYGVLTPGGVSKAANFTFTAVGGNGDVVVATLQLSDGAKDLGTVAFEFRLPATTSFTNAVAIAIPDHGIALPYPSAIFVSGLTGQISRVAVTLNELTHAFPDDVDVLLVGPTGQKLVLMSDTGGGHPVTNVTLTLDDDAATALPNSAQITTGTYKPANYESGDTFPPPAPVGTAGNALSAFNDTDANGTWSLYVVDDTTGDAGVFAEGWSLEITTVNPLAVIADVALTMNRTADPIYVAGTLTYTIGVTNLGPSPATGVTVTDVVPPGLNVVAQTSSKGSIVAVSNVVTASVGSLAPGAGAVIAIYTVPSLPGTFVNTADVVADETDPDPANNSAQTSASVLPASDLAVGITDAPDPLYVASTLVYTIGVTNLGPSPATEVTVTDALPAGLNYISGSSSQGTVGAVGNVVTAKLGTLAVGAAAIITVQTTPAQAGHFTNSVTVAGAETDLNPVNNSAQTTTLVNPLANLVLALRRTADPLYVNGTLIYTIGVTNLGPSPATGVTMTDTLPTGLNYVTSSSSQGSIGAVGNVVTANLGTLASGAGALMTIQTASPQTGTFTNTASVSGGEDDPNLANNSAQVSATVNPAADLMATITDSPDPLYVASGLVYTIGVTNLGPSPATGVTMTNVLPAGMKHVSSSSSQGTIGPIGHMVTANVGNLAVGAGAGITIRVSPSLGGSFTNSINVTGSEADLNLVNNHAQTATQVQVPAPVEFIDVIISNGQVQATLTGEPGQTYVIRASTNLTAWTPIVTNTMSGGGSIQFTDTNAPAFGCRFYGAVRQIP